MRPMFIFIKEEKTKVLKEQPIHMSGRNQNPMEQLHTAIDAMIAEMGNNETYQELLGIVEDWSGDAVSDGTGQHNEGTSPKQMPDTWQQVLGNCLRKKR